VDSSARTADLSHQFGSRDSLHARWWRFVRAYPLLLSCSLVLLCFAALAIFAPAVSPYDPNEQSLADSLSAPSALHWLGTDQGGRDILSRTIFGARVSMSVGFGAMVLGGALSTLVGGVSGFVGGWFDSILQRIVDAFLSIPSLIFLMTLLSIVGTSLTTLIVSIGLWSVVASCRTVRSSVVTVAQRPFVESAKAVGAAPARVFFAHVLPNVVAPCIVVSTLIFVYAVLTEAALSFLGFGIAPPAASWGGMLSGDSRALMLVAPWIGLSPGIALSIVVIAVNLLGDDLRDFLDPSLRGR